MKITRKNYFELIEHFNFNALPEELKRAHIVLMTRTVKGQKWQAVDDDPELKDLSRIAFAKLEEWISSRTGKSIPEATIRKRLHAEARKAAIDLIRPYVQKGYGREAIVAEMPAYRHWLYTIHLDGERLIVQQEHMGKQYMDEFKLADIIRSAGGKQHLEGTPRKPRPSSVQQDVWQAALDIIHYLVVDLDEEVADLKKSKRTIKNKLVTAELDGKGYLVIKNCEGKKIKEWFELDMLYRELLYAIQKTEYNQYYSFQAGGKAINDFASIAKEAMLIDRFMGLHDKVITRSTIEKFIEDLQEAITEKKIRKTSPVAKEIMEIQQAVIRMYNQMDRSLHVVLKPATMKRLKGIIVKFDNAVDRAERPERDKPKIKPVPLSGIPEAEPVGRLMNSTDFVKLNFDRIGFTGKWFDLIGDPAPGFTAMVFGKPKFGKSFLCIEWAGYLARNHGKVLYAAREEGLDATLQEKLKEKDVEHPNLTVSDYIPQDLSAYDFIFLDSVNKFGLSPQDLEKLKKANPGKSFIYIFQSTKEGKFRGTNAYQHDVDVVIEVPEKGKAVQFGRFNQGGEMNIFDKESQTQTEPALNGTPRKKTKSPDDFKHHSLMAGYYEALEQRLWDQISDLRSSSDKELQKNADELEKKRDQIDAKMQEHAKKKRQLYDKKVHGNWNDHIVTEEEALKYGQEQTGESFDGIRKNRAQLKNSTRVAHYHRYYYVIDLDERGSFRAHVEDQTGKTVFEFAAGNELGEDESDLFQDGWMRGKNDIGGLEKYLRQQGVLGRYDQIAAELEAGLGAAKSGGKKVLVIETELSIALKELADMIHLDGEDQSAAIAAIQNEEPRVGENLRKITQAILTRQQPNVKMQDISFKEIDTPNPDRGFAYFTITLQGEEKDLKKIAGVETDKKIFFYDWENHH